MNVRIAIAAGIVLITALGYLSFPGHTWLQQDTQIYLPILEHRYDPTVLAKDPVATNQHLGYSIYDEVALAARRLTGLSFHTVLGADQIVFRAVGVLGVFLIGTALGLARRWALLAAAVYALGASVMGPAVLTVEYEPKPRGSAVGMILLAIGFVGHGRLLAAGIAAAAAFLYHPPTVYPLLLVLAAMAIWPPSGVRRSEMLRAFIPLAVAAAFLLALDTLQTGRLGDQPWLTRLTPELERLQRFRASYNWIGSWIGDWAGHYLLLSLLIFGALYRLGDVVPARLRYFLAGMPLVGILSVGVSYLAYDIGKWAIMAKFQPARGRCSGCR